MTENSKNGGNVIHAEFGKNRAITGCEYVHRSYYSEEQFKKDPALYWYREAKRCEIALEFDDAAAKYTAAYSQALKDNYSSALTFKWEAMRCIEWAHILKGLNEEWAAVGRVGKMLDPFNRMVHWYDEAKVIPKDLIGMYKAKVPRGFPYNIVVYNSEDRTCRFCHASGFYTDSEPVIEREYKVHPDGLMESTQWSADPQMLFDKWMLMSDTKGTFDKRISIRRSIRLRYLNVPSPIKEKMHLRSVFSKYVLPYIGNRSISTSTYKEFLESKNT